MALIGNYSLINRTPFRQFANGVSSGYKETFTNGGSDQNRHIGGFSKYNGTPIGYLHPASWVLPKVSGGMASTNQSYGVLTSTSILAGGINGEANSSMTLNLTNAQLDQIVSFVASSLMTLSTTAQLNAAVGLQASAVLQLTVNADIQAIISVLASGNMTVTPNAILTALAHMNAEAGGPTPLSPEGLAEAVWSSVATDYNVAGTTGKMLQDVKRDLGKKLDTGAFIALK